MITYNIFPTTIAVDRYHDAENFKKIFEENRAKHSLVIDGKLHSTETSGHVQLHMEPSFHMLFDFIGASILKHLQMNLAMDTSKFDVYITKAWISSVKDHWHVPAHAHAEAHLSFCYYINVPENTDKLHFYTPKAANEPFYHAFGDFQRLVREYNVMNSTSWYFDTKDGELYIFPSHLVHNTKNNASNPNPQERVSIAGDVLLVLKENNKLSYGIQPISNWSKIQSI